MHLMTPKNPQIIFIFLNLSSLFGDSLVISISYTSAVSGSILGEVAHEGLLGKPTD